MLHGISIWNDVGVVPATTFELKYDEVYCIAEDGKGVVHPQALGICDVAVGKFTNCSKSPFNIKSQVLGTAEHWPGVKGAVI